MWKFHDFSITQILREKIFGDSTGCPRSKFPISKETVLVVEMHGYRLKLKLANLILYTL